MESNSRNSKADFLNVTCGSDNAKADSDNVNSGAHTAKSDSRNIKCGSDNVKRDFSNAKGDKNYAENELSDAENDLSYTETKLSNAENDLSYTENELSNTENELKEIGNDFCNARTNPCYVIDEKKLRDNLERITDISKRAKIEVILALKAFASWKTFPIFREYISHTTASSPWEAKLSALHFGGLCHTYSPAYEADTFSEILRYSEHITFNSIGQLQRFLPMVRAFEQSKGGHPVSLGLRINPEYSEIETLLYNPCAPGSRFGVKAEELGDNLPESIEGLHFHCLCENGADALEHVLEHVEEKFGHLLNKVRWLNMGGGHLMTRQGYDTERLVRILNKFHDLHPQLRLIMEPGSAFLWQTGFLRARVVDIVENSGIKTAILNVSFTCHMPDCLEMPYMPAVSLPAAATKPQTTATELQTTVSELQIKVSKQETKVSELQLETARQQFTATKPQNTAIEQQTKVSELQNSASELASPTLQAVQSSSINVLTEDERQKGNNWYRLGGNSCLSGDWMGYWLFPRPLNVGDELLFEDMIHYTTVKTNMFNGVAHPSLSLQKASGEEILLRKFTYQDYESRMD